MPERKKSRSSEDSVAPSYEILASVRTDRGCVREGNEDAGRFIKPNDPALLSAKGLLLIVADGMGGHLGGEVASRMAVELISRAYYEDESDAVRALRKALEEANRRIYEASLADDALVGMGTTCTALALVGGTAFVAHVGDSRLYLVRNGDIYLMTEDHSAVMELVKQGIITMDEARHHADKNIILRALGTHPQVEVSMWEEPLSIRAGDRYLLCSDGLYDLVEDSEIRQGVASARDPLEACENLIALAKERGGHDNITVAVVSIEPEGSLKEASLRPTREVEVPV